MKPVLRQITATPSSSFLVRKDTGKNMVNTWHYHPEIELLFIRKSSGTWLIGDHIGHFQPGDVVMIGPGLPHCFRHDPGYISGNETSGETICVKFVPEILGNSFWNLPEAMHIKQLLIKCGCGIKLTGKTRARVAAMIEKMLAATPGKKLVSLVSILEEIAENKKHLLLSSKGFMQLPGDTDKNRLKLVFDYTFSHYNEKITIDPVASLLNMTRQSFCRYFKSKTKKTYIQFLVEVRIGSACRLLVEDEKNVAGISYECGYNNISHFNHQFKFITGKKPLEYKRDYMKNNVMASAT
ncbi:MAG: AraC family transcriptional regulator [Bacteroidota bacterium]